MKICGIYKITNPNGAVYVGSSKDIYKRWMYYKNLYGKAQIKLYRSFLKYGVENHLFEIVAIESSENILKYEHIIGMLYNVLDKEGGLNLKLPKYGDSPTVVSDESKERMRNSQLGKKMSPESIEKTRQANLGRKNTEETKLKMSIAGKGRIVSEETRMKLSLAKIGSIGNNTGKKHTEEAKLKIGLASKSRIGMKYNKTKNLNSPS